MTTRMISPPPPPGMLADSESRLDPAVERIIATARRAPAPARAAWILSGMSALLLWASFAPLDGAPLAWIALVPLILLIRIPRRTRRMYLASYAGGFFFTLAATQWLRLGDPSMYLAWIALAVYMGLYFPAFVATCRIAVHRYSVPLVVAVPVVWVGLEFLRAHLMTGFAWYFLGHTQYQWIELIQISDLVGAYGVSFVVAMASAAMAGLVSESLLAWLGLTPVRPDDTAQGKGPTRGHVVSVFATIAVLIAVLSYGYVRRAQADFREGLRVALIQGNFGTSLKHDPNQTGAIFKQHFLLTGQAVQHQPDLTVWPETMFRYPLLQSPEGMDDLELRSVAPVVPPETWRDPTVKNMLHDLSQQTGAPMIVGIDTLETDHSGYRRFNSAVFIRPELGITDRYDKIHRVIFGEYIPLKEQFPWLHRLTPFGDDFGIAAGERSHVFRYGDWSVAPIICFEDTVPHLVRQIVAEANSANGKPIDCLVNLTNDGWFWGSTELDQHLITSLFRAVECRTPLVRAVNTGISAFVDGDGVVIEPEVFLDGDELGRTSMRDPETGQWHKQLNAALISNVPLDNRTSRYVEWGDWFAASCLFATVLTLFLGLMPGRSKQAVSS